MSTSPDALYLNDGKPASRQNIALSGYASDKPNYALSNFAPNPTAQLPNVAFHYPNSPAAPVPTDGYVFNDPDVGQIWFPTSEHYLHFQKLSNAAKKADYADWATEPKPGEILKGIRDPASKFFIDRSNANPAFWEAKANNGSGGFGHKWALGSQAVQMQINATKYQQNPQFKKSIDDAITLGNALADGQGAAVIIEDTSSLSTGTKTEKTWGTGPDGKGGNRLGNTQTAFANMINNGSYKPASVVPPLTDFGSSKGLKGFDGSPQKQHTGWVKAFGEAQRQYRAFQPALQKARKAAGQASDKLGQADTADIGAAHVQQVKLAAGKVANGPFIKAPQAAAAKVLVINGHGAKIPNKKVKIAKNSPIITPGSASESYLTSFDNQNRHLEEATSQGKLWPVTDAEGKAVPWTQYQDETLDDIKISPLQDNFDFKKMASDLLTKGMTHDWAKLTTPAHDPIARGALAVRDTTGALKILEGAELKDYLQAAQSGSGKYAGFREVFYCDKELGKVKPMGDTSLSEINQGIEKIDEFKAIGTKTVVATCSPAADKSAKSLMVNTKAPMQDISKAVVLHQAAEPAKAEKAEPSKSDSAKPAATDTVAPSGQGKPKAPPADLAKYVKELEQKCGKDALKATFNEQSNTYDYKASLAVSGEDKLEITGNIQQNGSSTVNCAKKEWSKADVQAFVQHIEALGWDSADLTAEGKNAINPPEMLKLAVQTLQTKGVEVNVDQQPGNDFIKSAGQAKPNAAAPTPSTPELDNIAAHGHGGMH